MIKILTRIYLKYGLYHMYNNISTSIEIRSKESFQFNEKMKIYQEELNRKNTLLFMEIIDHVMKKFSNNYKGETFEKIRKNITFRKSKSHKLNEKNNGISPLKNFFFNEEIQELYQFNKSNIDCSKEYNEDKIITNTVGDNKNDIHLNRLDTNKNQEFNQSFTYALGLKNESKLGYHFPNEASFISKRNNLEKISYIGKNSVDDSVDDNNYLDNILDNIEPDKKYMDLPLSSNFNNIIKTPRFKKGKNKVNSTNSPVREYNDPNKNMESNTVSDATIEIENNVPVPETQLVYSKKRTPSSNVYKKQNKIPKEINNTIVEKLNEKESEFMNSLSKIYKNKSLVEIGNDNYNLEENSSDVNLRIEDLITNTNNNKTEPYNNEIVGISDKMQVTSKKCKDKLIPKSERIKTDLKLNYSVINSNISKHNLDIYGSNGSNSYINHNKSAIEPDNSIYNKITGEINDIRDKLNEIIKINKSNVKKKSNKDQKTTSPYKGNNSVINKTVIDTYNANDSFIGARSKLTKKKPLSMLKKNSSNQSTSNLLNKTTFNTSPKKETNHNIYDRMQKMKTNNILSIPLQIKPTKNQKTKTHNISKIKLFFFILDKLLRPSKRMFFVNLTNIKLFYKKEPIFTNILTSIHSHNSSIITNKNSQIDQNRKYSIKILVKLFKRRAIFYKLFFLKKSKRLLKLVFMMRLAQN